MVNSWIVHGLECDDGHKLGPTELVLKSDYDRLEAALREIAGMGYSPVNGHIKIANSALNRT